MFDTEKVRQFEDLGYADEALESPEAAVREVMQSFHEQLRITDEDSSTEYLALYEKCREHLHVAVDAAMDRMREVANETGKGKILKPGERFKEGPGHYTSGTFVRLEDADES